MFWRPRIAREFRPAQWKGRGLGLTIFFFAAIIPLCSQKSPSNPNPLPPLVPPPPVYRDSKAPDYGPPSEKTRTFEEKQYREYLAYRLKSMTADTNKLLKLAQELNQKIETSGPGSLSRDDLRKLAEIEKLAHDVKWKMQLATSGNPAP